MRNTASQSLPCGVWTALVTPFLADESVDFEAFDRLVGLQIEGGIQALVPCGTTGESATLSDEEKVSLAQRCVSVAEGRIPVIAGAGQNDTRKAVSLHQKMKTAGVAATLQVTPYYNKPTQEGLYRHFRAIAESSDLPVVLYNVPSRTGVDLKPETVLRLAEDCPTIAALKDTTTDTVRVQELICDLRRVRPDFRVLSGEDGFLLPLLAMGGHGLISVGSNWAPSLFADVYNNFRNGHLEQAAAHFEKVAALTPLMFMSANPLPVKTALSFRSLLQNHYRLPLCPMQDAENEQLKSALTAQGWL
jgi:4-hydroxy-tetrahydrodipicolinate synthase